MSLASHINKLNPYELKCNQHIVFLLGTPYNMALLTLLGYLLCNVLLAWATLQ